MKKIVLYGKLANDFGREIMLDVRSIAEAVRALEANFPGRFYNALREGDYRVAKTAEGPCVPADTLAMMTGSEEIHIEPVLRGAGGGGGGGRGKAIAQVIAGVALVAFAVTGFGIAGMGLLAEGVTFTTAVWAGGPSYGALALLGTSVALAGVSSLLTSDPRLRPETIAEREKPEDRPSFIFNGAVNVVEQGGPVPFVYGRMQTGSVVLSAAIDVDDVPV